MLTKCLIIDDDPADRRNFVHIVRDLGYDYDEAENSIKGIQNIKRNSYDLILLDIVMPDFSGRKTDDAGIKVLKLIRELRPDLPVIMISALHEGKLIRETLKELGATDYIIKGDNSDADIKKIIKNALKNPKRELLELLENGEGQQLEFKATLRWNSKTQSMDDDWWIKTLKVIVSFLNTDGGKLLLGVRDNKYVCGIEVDRFPDNDKFLLYLNNLIHDHIGDEFTKYIRTEFIRVYGKTVLMVNCQKADEPVFLLENRNNYRYKEDFYIRNKNLTQKLTAKATWLHLKKQLEQKVKMKKK
jgi:CheY-like chemotaxis protein